MDQKSDIITFTSNALANPKEFVAGQTAQEAANLYIFIDELVKNFKKELREKLLQEKTTTFTWNYNGKTKTLKISKAGVRYEDYIDVTFDLDAVRKYAEENNLEIPMLKPEIDFDKLKMLDWFQFNVEKFVKKEIKQKKIESNDMLKIV